MSEIVFWVATEGSELFGISSNFDAIANDITRFGVPGLTKLVGYDKQAREVVNYFFRGKSIGFTKTWEANHD